LPTAEEIAAFAPATSDVFNTGVAAILGCDYKYGFSSFVVDQGVATIRESLQEAMHRSVISAQIVFGEPCESLRVQCINPNKWERQKSHILRYLGFIWNSRTMELSWPPDNKQSLPI
jgi:hypothetical protein